MGFDDQRWRRRSRIWARQMARDRDQCRRIGAELLSVAAEHGFAFHRCGGLAATGSALLAEGDFERAEMILKEALVGYRKVFSGYLLPLVLGELARATHQLGKSVEAQALVREGLALVDANEERSDEAPLQVLQGEIVLAEPDGVAQAEGCFQRALATARAQDARLFELRAATNLARLWVEQGERQKGYELLAPVYGWFTEGFEAADLTEARALLDELS